MGLENRTAAFLARGSIFFSFTFVYTYTEEDPVRLIIPTELGLEPKITELSHTLLSTVVLAIEISPPQQQNVHRGIAASGKIRIPLQPVDHSLSRRMTA